MRTDTKGSTNVLMYLAVAVVLVAVLWFGLSGSQVPATVEEGKAVAIGYNSAVCKEVTRADGSKEDLGCKHNLFTSMGKDMVRDLLGIYSSLAAVNVISLGNATGADQGAANVSLGQEYGANPPAACGLGRAAGSFSNVTTSAGNWSVSKVFTATCNALNVSATGLYNATSGNFLFAETTFTPATLQTNDQINITWYIWVT